MKESSSKLELELKLGSSPPDDDILEWLRSRLGPRWAIVHEPPATILDYYFDTSCMALYSHGATFRFRTRTRLYRSRRHSFSANFKPPAANLSGLYMERQEIRTQLTPAEVALYRVNAVPGRAATLVYEYLGAHEVNTRWATGALLEPIMYMTSQRRTYGICPRQDRRGMLVALVLEDVLAYGLSDADGLEVIQSGRLEVTNTPVMTRLHSAELEHVSQYMAFRAEARDLFIELSEALHAEYGSLLDSKYSIVVRRLGLHNEAAAASPKSVNPTDLDGIN